MKNRLCTLCALALFVYQPAQTQTFSERKPKLRWGIYVGGNDLTLAVDGQLADKYRLYNTAERYQGVELGAFARLRLSERAFVQPSLSYLSSTYFVQLQNLKPEEELAQLGRGWQFIGPVYDFRRASAGLTGGYRLMGPFRLMAGLLASYQFRDRTYANQHPDTFTDPIRRADRLMYAYADSPHRVNLSGQAGVGLDVGRFTVDALYERNLTPFASTLTLDNTNYLLLQRFSLLKLQLGFSIVR